MNRKLFSAALMGPLCGATLLLQSGIASAAEYAVDSGHSFVEFRIQHLGYSWLYGRFNTVAGKFNYDEDNPEASSINITIDPASVDTNHEKRDAHIKGEDFLDVAKYTNASFTSTKYTGDAQAGELEGTLNLHGVTQPITISINKLGEGEDPWGGYRAGFAGTVTLDRKDFGIEYDLGPKSWVMEIELGIEGIKQ